MGMGMGAPGQVGFDASAAYKHEREALGIVTWQEWEGDKAERMLLGDSYPEQHTVTDIDLSK